MELQKPGRGGYRPGAGRKPKPKTPEDFAVASGGLVSVEPDTDPLVMLQRIMTNEGIDIKLRVEAMKAMLPYTHFKKGEGGKKDQRQTDAEKVAGGKFATAATPPVLLRKVA